MCARLFTVCSLLVALVVGTLAGVPAAHAAADHGIGGADGLWPWGEPPVPVQRHAGATRLETAAEIADDLGAEHGDDPAAAAVLARADDYADALAGVGLAHARGAPLLLTPGAALDAVTGAALRRHLRPGATVYVLGGTGAVSAAVSDEVRALGFEVSRLAGADRYETAVTVATVQMEAMGKDGAGTAVVASGADFADALTVSVPAARGGWPVLLTPPDALHPATAAFLRAHGTHGIEVVGGGAAVDDRVADALDAIAPVRRTAGVDRYATAAAVAARFLGAAADEVGLTADTDAGMALAGGTAWPDALPGAVLAARSGAPLLLTGDRLPDATAAAVTAARPSVVHVFGGPAAVSERAVSDLLRSLADVDPPRVEWQPSPSRGLRAAPDEPLPPLTLRIPLGMLTTSSRAVVSRDGAPVDARVTVDGDRLVIRVTEPATSFGVGRSVTIRVQAALFTAGATAAYVDEDVTVRVDHPVLTTPEGYHAVSGTGPVVGDGGRLRTYSLEVEPGTGVDARAFTAIGDRILSDPRSWTAGDWRLQRVEPQNADIRVLLARPATVDRLCAQVGLRTGGIFSCWNDEFAALNLMRWNEGAAGFGGALEDYRGYLVNHELGHGLGYGHRGCPASGALAPVMMQQTKTTGACRPNAWPFPGGG